MGEGWKKLWEEGSGCWLWLGHLNPKTGYGKKMWHGTTYLAHRWMYEQRVGPIPEGMVIDHLCRIRHCVNPDHLEVVTHEENCRRGDGAKLTEEQRAEILAVPRYSHGLTEVCKRLGVNYNTARSLRAGLSWKN